jgi:hypothetical protein
MEERRMEERRREERKKLMAFTPAYDSSRGRLLGYVHDLTMGGAMVVGERELQIGTPETLAIEFPSDLFGGTITRMEIPARVVRCTLDEGSLDIYTIGLEFVNLAPENAKIIQALLERYHFRHRI